MKYSTPFPWPGSKGKIAAAVWQRLGADVKNYVEPFFGSGAVLLARPGGPVGRIETVNDADGYVANFWRAVKYAPEEVAHYADWPVTENDLHARHVWLKEQRPTFTRRLEGDPEFYDPKVAGWWVWGLAAWIGPGFSSDGTSGPWHRVNDMLLKRPDLDPRDGIKRGLPELHAIRKVLRCYDNPDEHHNCTSCASGKCGIYRWMAALAARLRYVRVTCGDFERVLGHAPTISLGTTAVFLDPPYSTSYMRHVFYAQADDTAASRARRWALAAGDDPRYRIALCGYEGDHDMPDDWECLAWTARGGFANRRLNGENANKYRERIWFSPHCLKPNTMAEALL